MREWVKAGCMGGMLDGDIGEAIGRVMDMDMTGVMWEL